MPTTTNYSWTTPADTDLVKDGASAIRTLGTAIDTTVFNNASAAIAKTIVDAKGDLIVASGADAVARLAVGTNDYVLTADSAATNGVKWAALPASGGMTLISETVASANSGISFSSLGSYKQLLLVWSGIKHSTTGSSFVLRFNADGGTNYYNIHQSGLNQNSDTAPKNNESAQGFSSAINLPMFGQNVTNAGLALASFGTCLIDNYTSTTKIKSYQAQYGYYEDNAGQSNYSNLNGVWNSTSAITSIDITRSSGSATLSNHSNTSIRLYGVS